MGRTVANRVRETREARGMSQLGLARAVGLSRQSVGAIETGRATPAVDVALRMAGALGCRVEDLFGSAPLESGVATEPAAAPIGSRVALAHVAGRWVSYPLDRAGMRTSADALVGAVGEGRVDVDPVRPIAEARDNVVLMGCAAALGLLADRLNARSGPGRFLWLGCSSTSALEALARGQTHVAGAHLVDARTGEFNVADVRRLTRPGKFALITLARWEAGLVARRRNPMRIRSAGDLGRRGLRFVTRETGSGARRLLDRTLRREGLPIDMTTTGCVRVDGHIEVAHAVSIGAGDVGVATRDAAIAFGLDFIPLAEERYDLAIPLDDLADPRLRRLFDVMTSAAYRRELSVLGYDVRPCGDRVWQTEAA